MSSSTPNTEAALRASKRPRSILAGPYGHPFHPLLVTIPIGTWVASLVFDIAGAVTDEWDVFATAAQWLIAIGIIGAILAAIAGLLDFTKLTPQTKARRTATIHMVINLAVVVLFAISWLLRANNFGWEPNAWALVCSFAAVVLAVGTAWMGGELVERLGIGVDEGANVDAPSSLTNKHVSA
jgi:uncharacterized membrane protein